MSTKTYLVSFEFRWLGTDCFANIYNSTVIEICVDKIRITKIYQLPNIRIHSITAPVALRARMDIFIVFDQFYKIIGFANK